VNLEKRIAAVEEVLYRRGQNLELLRRLTGLLPTDTFLTLYRNQDCTIQLRGNSPASSSSDLIGKLEKSPFLRDVTTTAGVYRDPQTGKDVFHVFSEVREITVKISLREQRFLIAGAVLALAVLVFYLSPLILPQDLSASVEAKKALLQRQKEMIAQEAGIKARIAAAEQRWSTT